MSASVHEWRGLLSPGGVSLSSGIPGPRMRGQSQSVKIFSISVYYEDEDLIFLAHISDNFQIFFR